MIFDTHSHYLSKPFDADRQELLENLPFNGVEGVIDCATDYESALKSLELSTQYPYMYTAVGIHPQSLIEETASTVYKYKGDWQAELNDIETLLTHERCVAIGECGLDYHWPVPKQAQLLMFKAHLDLAKKHNMPIIIHDREAHGDMYALLQEYKPKGVLHCYSGSADDAVRLVNDGLHIGFGGAITFKNAKRALEAVAALPLNKILLETDCPYMAPEPYRGKRCDSTLIDFVAQKIAEIKGITKEEVLQTTSQNAKLLFNIKD